MGQSNYQRHTTDSVNPLARFAHRRRVKFSIELVDKWAPLRGSVVDFGAGTGLFINSLHNRRVDLHLCGIEPYMAVDPTSARLLPDLEALEDSSQNVVTAFEVCEHLTSDEMGEFLAGTFRVLRDSGKLILSVPVMFGLAIVPKEINRVLFVRQFDYSGKELLAAIFGQNVERASNIKTSHKGFDFRGLESVLQPKFYIWERIYSPFPNLPWWVNSQVFLVCSKSTA
jgi:2-polyprenyl-3-methyl-5-hydroxy-6-metoxy-1,4-benzoquinol methylase